MKQYTHTFNVYPGTICYYDIERFSILVEVCDIRGDKVEITPVAGLSDIVWVPKNSLYVRTP